MRGKLITRCGECVDYDYKKHRCRRGCNEGEPQEPFYSDCPLPTVDTDQICKQSEPISCGHEKGGGWISVSERLPEKQANFLIADDKGNMEIALWTKQFGWFSGGNRVKKVTHWMPLPEVPKMKEGAE